MEKFYKTLDYWQEKYDGMVQLEPEPFKGAPITERSTFLFSSSASPMVPCGADYSGWYHMPNAYDLASYLRFMILPVYFAWALDLDEQTDSGISMLSVEDLLEKLETRDEEYDEDDVVSIKSVVELLDEALEAKSDAEAFHLIRRAQDSFNNELGGAGGWSFEIKVYNNPMEVGDELAENYDPDEWAEDNWDEKESEEDSELEFEDEASLEERQRTEMKSICENAATDREKGKILLTLIRRTHMGMD